jgi:hypothetical protein
VNVRDLLLIPTSAAVVDDGSEPAGEPPVALTDTLTLSRLEGSETQLVMTACTARGHHFIPVRQFSTLYAFINSVDLEAFRGHPYHWDDDHLLYYTVVLSRLIRDNGYALEFAARLVDHEDGQRQVIPARPHMRATYRLRQDRDWFTAEEAAELGLLLETFLRLKDDLPRRIVHALNLSEDAVHLQFFQRSVLLLGAALEALIQTSRHFVALQVRERLPRVAEEVGIADFTEDLTGELYDARSEAAHGAEVAMFAVRPPSEDEPELPDAQPSDDGEPTDLNAAAKSAKG